MAEYIEREALLKDAAKDRAIGLCEADIVDVRELINAQPAADVAPVVYGRWNICRWNCESRDYRGKIVEAECSECNGVFEIPMLLFGLCYNYCPNCGAKMDGGNTE